MLPILSTAQDVQDIIRINMRSLRLARNWTQKDLSERSGVALGSLKRFESTGEVSLASLVALAEALGALDEFTHLFPLPDARRLDELSKQRVARQRASGRKP